MISIKTRNIESITKKLGEVPWGARGAATESAAKVIIGNERTGLQRYPPKPTGSIYSRTYKLRFGWQVSKWGDGTAIRIRNEVPYAPWVQGSDTQAYMHKGRWSTVAMVIESNAAAINKAIGEAVHRFLKAKGLV
jgi:hypothetical protein